MHPRPPERCGTESHCEVKSQLSYFVPLYSAQRAVDSDVALEKAKPSAPFVSCGPGLRVTSAGRPMSRCRSFPFEGIIPKYKRLALSVGGASFKGSDRGTEVNPWKALGLGSCLRTISSSSFFSPTRLCSTGADYFQLLPELK